MVLTRSQAKKAASIPVASSEDRFVAYCRQTMGKINQTVDVSAKIVIMTDFFAFTNAEFPSIFLANPPKWEPFLEVLLTKCAQLKHDAAQHADAIGEKPLKKFFGELSTFANFCKTSWKPRNTQIEEVLNNALLLNNALRAHKNKSPSADLRRSARIRTASAAK